MMPNPADTVVVTYVYETSDGLHWLNIEHSDGYQIDATPEALMTYLRAWDLDLLRVVAQRYYGTVFDQ